MAVQNTAIDLQQVPGKVMEVQQKTFNGTLNAGSALTLTEAAHSGLIINLSDPTASVVTLPAATGSGARFRFLVTTVPSGSHKVQVANANDFMIGTVSVGNTSTKAGSTFAAANSGTVSTNSDTVTLDHTNTGAVIKGEYVELIDVSANTWWIEGQLTGGTPATPFSAAV